jgi:metallophosphoesterase (TIGR00282 family)
VINLQGRVFMPNSVDDPFRAAETILKEHGSYARVVIVDMHAEATSEKIAMGWFLDGRASVVFGTHTHVQTADERILPRGTAYITDLGMCGPLDSVIGIKKELSIERFLTQRPNQYEVAKNLVYLQGVVIDIDDQTGRARAITRLREHLPGT